MTRGGTALQRRGVLHAQTPSFANESFSDTDTLCQAHHGFHRLSSAQWALHPFQAQNKGSNAPEGFQCGT